MNRTKEILNRMGGRGPVLLVLLVALAVGWLLRGCWTPAAPAAPKTEPAAAPAAGKTQWWTCAMHPQIRLPKPGKCPICGMTLIPLAQGSEGGLRELSISPDDARLMQIETSPVERRFATAEVRMVGQVDYDETRVSYITAWVPGRLDRLYVDYTGVPVKKGDHMVYLYSPELLSAQEELLQAVQTMAKLGDNSLPVLRETTRTTVDSAREKLRLLGLNAAQVAAIEQRGAPDDHMTIYAPSGGIVVEKNAEEGMYVKTGTRIYTIADLTQVWVNLDAYESDLAWLRYGQQVQFTIESHPGREFTGTIAFIHPMLNEMTRTVKVRVNVPNPRGELKPGMFVRAVVHAEVATGRRIRSPALAGKWICPMHPSVVKDGPGDCDICGMPLVRAESLGYVGPETTERDRPLVIPDSAPLLTGTRAVVYVEIPDRKQPTYEGREIVLGPHAGAYYIVKAGLEEGERVVTKGNFKLDAELQIKAQPSMMTPEGGGGGGMAGMNMGGEKSMASPAGAPAAGAGGMISAAARTALGAVVSAAEEAIAASAAESLPRIHAAYGALDERVKVFPVSVLPGTMGVQWKECAMLLGNDGVVGEGVASPAGAARLATTTQIHLDELRKKFGLPAEVAAPPAPAAASIAPTFRKGVAALVERYRNLRAALSADDVSAAAKAATAARSALAAVDAASLSGPALADWKKSREDLAPVLDRLAGAKDIDPARKDFALFSEVAASLVSRYRPLGTPVYQFHCPMAFNGAGANWLQESKEAQNPYLGRAMPQCGAIANIYSAGPSEGDHRHD